MDCSCVENKKAIQLHSFVLASALILRIHDRVGMKLTTLAPDDPRVISKHLAGLEPPSTEELVRQQKSRCTEQLIYSTKHYLFVLTAFKVPNCIQTSTSLNTNVCFCMHFYYMSCKFTREQMYILFKKKNLTSLGKQNSDFCRCMSPSQSIIFNSSLCFTTK